MPTPRPGDAGGAAGGPDTDAADGIVRTATAALASGMRPEMEYATGDEIYQLSFVPVADRCYVNVYGRKITRRKRAEATATRARGAGAEPDRELRGRHPHHRRRGAAHDLEQGHGDRSPVSPPGSPGEAGVGGPGADCRRGVGGAGVSRTVSRLVGQDPAGRRLPAPQSSPGRADPHADGGGPGISSR